MPSSLGRLRLQTFGGLSLTRDDSSLSGAALQPRRLAVLAVIAAAGERGITRAKLLGLLWEETDEHRARQALSQSLYALRRDCACETVVLGGEHLRLDPTAADSDVMEFEAACTARDDAQVAALHVGPFLDGVYLKGSPEFERWLDEHRARYAAQAEQAMERLAAAADLRGDHAMAAAWWRRLTALDPLRTSAALGVMRALAAAGDRADALRHADQYARRVRDELEAEPSAAVVELADALRGESSVEAGAGGALAGRYEIESELGRGGMAVVYRARDLRHGRAVAVKMLHAELSATIGRDRLEREIVVTAGLRHPHILPLFDSGEADGTLFYVMPYVEGESLRARLARDGTLPIADAVQFAREIAEALHHAHVRGIVHRDVKPENVLLSEGHAVVMDFGIASTLSTAAEMLTQHGFAIGTPTYMSPEQISGDRNVDARSDVFALGCVLYEMLAGRPPWLGATVQELLVKRFVTEPPDLRTLRADVPHALSIEVRRSLSVDPADRHESAAALARCLAVLGSAAGDRAERSIAALPTVPGTLVGRERELAAAHALVVRDDVRLLTLTGAGGSGKTHLAMQLAADAAGHFLDGVKFVDLSTVLESDLVLSSIASALGVREIEGRKPLDGLAAHIGARRLLLLLDNLEQLVGSAPALSQLLGQCPGLTVVATSRVRLRIRGEHEFFVAPLRVPDLADRATSEQLESIPSVQLFLLRAAQARDGFTAAGEELHAVAEICVRLDGLPLAIELAAARCRLLTPRAMLKRMDRRFELLTGGARDLPARQQTLRGAIDWSYGLLQSAERSVLRHLGVFAGGATIEAAASVLELDEAALLEGAQGLADASMVRRIEETDGDVRLVLLESVREFALEQLDAEGEGARARHQHLQYFATRADRLGGDLGGANQATALALLARDGDNLRAALEYGERAGDAGAFARLVLSLWRVWLVRGQWTEGREWIDRAAAAVTEESHLLAQLLAAGATLSQNQGDYDAAYALAERALALWRRAHDRRGEARMLATMGWLDWRRCRYAEARRLSAESLELHRAIDDERGAAQALTNLGWIALFEGDSASAVAVLEESLAIRRALGDRRNVAFTMTTLAWALSRTGATSRARGMLDDARVTFQDIGERQLLAFNMRVTATIDVGTGRAAEAATALEEVSIPVFREIGDRWGLCVALCVLGDALVQLRRGADAHRAREESLEIALAIGDGMWTATGLSHRAVACAERGDLAAASELVTRIDGLLAKIGAPLPAEHRQAYDRSARMLHGWKAIAPVFS